VFIAILMDIKPRLGFYEFIMLVEDVSYKYGRTCSENVRNEQFLAYIDTFLQALLRRF